MYVFQLWGWNNPIVWVRRTIRLWVRYVGFSSEKKNRFCWASYEIIFLFVSLYFKPTVIEILLKFLWISQHSSSGREVFFSFTLSTLENVCITYSSTYLPSGLSNYRALHSTFSYSLFLLTCEPTCIFQRN